MNRKQELIQDILKCSFECEAGPLKDCFPWDQLVSIINEEAKEPNSEKLIDNWFKTIGLTVDRVEEWEFKEYDDPVLLTIIHFTNGKFVVQEDQQSFTTSCGLLSVDEFQKWTQRHKSFKLKN